MSDNDLSDKLLERLAGLAAEASPGPWHTDPSPGMPWEIGRFPVAGDWDGDKPCVWLLASTNMKLGNGDDSPMAVDYDYGRTIRDAKFIAAANPATVLALVAEVRRLRAELAAKGV